MRFFAQISPAIPAVRAAAGRPPRGMGEQGTLRFGEALLARVRLIVLWQSQAAAAPQVVCMHGVRAGWGCSRSCHAIASGSGSGSGSGAGSGAVSASVSGSALCLWLCSRRSDSQALPRGPRMHVRASMSVTAAPSRAGDGTELGVHTTAAPLIDAAGA